MFTRVNTICDNLCMCVCVCRICWFVCKNGFCKTILGFFLKLFSRKFNFNRCTVSPTTRSDRFIIFVAGYV